MNHEKHVSFMGRAIEQATQTMNDDIGGPFGALIIDENNQVIAVSSNTVLGDHDPTAHAEINVIRLATKFKGTHDLSGCTLYATSFPCPMCLGAIMWSNIKKVYYGCTPKDAESIGFKDNFIYDFIKQDMKDVSQLEFETLDRDACLKLFKDYQAMHKIIY